MRMVPAMFQVLLARVGPRIEKEDTFWREVLDPGLKLTITLPYLATGNSYMPLIHGFRVVFNAFATSSQTFVKPSFKNMVSKFSPALQAQKSGHKWLIPLPKDRTSPTVLEPLMGNM